ncbi:MAG: single-stranded DNA-binding protein [Caldilineaceae bacterium]|nr:single-stranded DNA-binding protein [Caldilineaceae bacterium]
MFQQLTAIGNLGNDPEMRYTPSGEPFTRFRMAVSRRWTRDDGSSQERTTWFNVTLWRRQAEVANQYLTKGKRVLIIGEIEGARPYTDREGNPRATIDVTARELRFVDSRTADQDGDEERDEHPSELEPAEAIPL